MEFNPAQTIKFLTELFSQKCNIVYAGPILKTKCEPHMLKLLETSIHEAIEKAVPITKDRSAYNYGVKIRRITDIKYNDEEPDSICFEVRQNVSKFWLQGKGAPGSNSRLLYLGIMASVGYSGQRFKRITTWASTNLPVFIFKGQPKVWKIIKSELYRLLNCMVICRELSDENVKVIAGLHILQYIASSKHKKKIIKCLVEQEMDASSLFELHLNLDNWMEFWTELQQSDVTSITPSLVDRIVYNWSKMTTNVYTEKTEETFIDSSKAKFEEIVMSDFYCNKNGQIKLKVSKKEDVLTIINYLTMVSTSKELLVSKSSNVSKNLIPVDQVIPAQPPKRRKTSKR